MHARGVAVLPETRADVGELSGPHAGDLHALSAGNASADRPVLPPVWQVHAIAPDLRLHIVRGMPALPAALEAEIDRLWAVAQARMAGKLFNGRVFNADTLAADRLSGHWTECRRIVAQMERPELFAHLGQRPLAVNGIVQGPGGVVFGQRAAGAVYQPGQWQLPPAGSVDAGAARPDGTVDPLAALIAELREELGLPPEAVQTPRPLATVKHAGSMCSTSASPCAPR